MRHRRMIALAILPVALVAGGCSVEVNNNGPATGTPSPAPGPSAGFTLPDASELCTDLEERGQEMRTYTRTIGRITLNGLVIDWASRNQVDLVALASNRGAVDEALEAACPGVRSNVMDDLEIESIASALVGLPE
ncbi:hypothetical protein HT102_03500 [Hoyosella sp. G463]|uniref:Lipoprotein n=1 Tax=Lolliginicoccus lacisalsi TaxID=2742202 RepID=A0A927JAG0_9ACTN|nr:hypothetical protein [Lolliginicoccus lacisalsi]MBD8505555.1 hypothetical protein [Lolliginicoccus lacisalsi]